MDSVLSTRADVRRLVGGWLLLALLALALSTACAVLLVAARTPLLGGVASSGELFRRALVLHVGLAVVVWFLCCAAALWTLAADAGAGRWRWTALGLACAGVLAMMLPLFSATAAPVLANYIPVLHSPVFLLGLVWFLAGVALCGATSVSALVSRLRRAIEAWRVAVLLSIAAAALALIALTATAVAAGAPAGPADFETLAWGPGHLLQFVHVILLMAVWTMLGEQALGQPVAARSFLIGLLLLAAIPLLAAPAIYAAYPIGSMEFRRAFTMLMAWGSWPAPAILAGWTLWRLARAGRAAAASACGLPLLLSVLLFLLGCVFGASIRGESTMVPAHYHGTVGAVTLAYMALGYRLLPGFGFDRPGGRLVRWQPAIYGIGLMLLAGALAWSGWLGVPRKTMHVEAMMQYPAYLAATGLLGLGGFLAVSGAGLFVLNMLRILRAARMRVAPPVAFRAWRGTLASTLGLMLASGVSLAYWPGLAASLEAAHVSASKDPARHALQMKREEIGRQFAQAVALLNAKQYQAAASALHRVLELAPRMPEAHVNMGFAMIGLQDYAMARDFFHAAIDLRTSQINAYYGLAVALEGLQDIPGALGAMRTYVHRSKPDDPYLAKANAAIWEWEEELRSSRGNALAYNAAALPENGKSGVRYPITEKKLR